MSLRFFTNTKTGELMSRLNNDVVGAQNAISNTIVGIVTNIIEAIALLAVMLTLEWRLTLVSIVILPLFIIAAQRLGTCPARYCPSGHGDERADERAHERNPQHRRRTACQTLWSRQTKRKNVSVNAPPTCAISASAARWLAPRSSSSLDSSVRWARRWSMVSAAITSSPMSSRSAPSSRSVRISVNSMARCKVSQVRPSNFQPAWFFRARL